MQAADPLAIKPGPRAWGEFGRDLLPALER
jgi:hypothetical protein